MKEYIRNGLAVVGGGYLLVKLGCYFFDRYKEDIMDYAADALVDYISEEENSDEKKSMGDKMKKKVLLAYLKKGANK